ncbi:hypothetical protein M1N81_00685 [Dehalococcoidia bacterium]|nr:hypothetical protein [Dehalococcoidia bacterium]MCL0103843.1 hypothetical protein [Dehalococcoidia bacterium]
MGKAFVGIDVSKDCLEVYVRPSGEPHSWGQVFTFDFWRDTMRLTVE